MRIIQLQLCVLMWCQATETLYQLTDLGQNVTIDCDLDDEDVYWILQKQSDSPTVILHSFSNPTFAFHFNKTLKNKYSVQSKHRLVIYNVTVDELGVYYCMNKDTPPKLSHSTRLNIIEPTQLTEFNTSECKNHTNVTEQNSTQWKTFTLISGLLNAVLIITGFLNVVTVVNGCWNRSGNSSQLYNTELQQTQHLKEPQEPNQLQYVTVVFQAV
ncbi:uncharacterized protein LOC130549849 [Triplophysa rosa]|uniref:Immunoglobulin domain-containing protein n=1 Tax=Triplophysa rosa TaxID=992332 RepID=A0A9W7W851_TRIRA|nr:uncharacterized protein LOC130549849 [Triplophysa rosa]KAI7789585.1 hypothetical protein IRJ41_012540 [Triplophysa rosa]